MNKSLLLDIGSTNIKWVVKNGNEVSEEKQVLFPEKLPFPTPYYEVDINRILDIITSIIQEEQGCNRLFISTQMHGYILTDRYYYPVTNYISWQDKRAKTLDVPFEISMESGTSLKTNLPRVSIYAMKTLQKGIYKYATHFFTLGSYIAFYLTKRNETHITDACPTGFYNASSGKTIDFDLSLPRASLNVKPIGKYKKMQVYTPIGDQQASVLGVKDHANAYIINLGTAAQVCCIKPGFNKGNYESRPYFNEQTLCTVTGLKGGQFITNHTDDDLEQSLVEDYKQAIVRLPKCQKIIVIGGVIKYHQALIKNVLNDIGLPYYFDFEASALNGLSTLEKEIIKNE